EDAGRSASTPRQRADTRQSQYGWVGLPLSLADKYREEPDGNNTARALCPAPEMERSGPGLPRNRTRVVRDCENVDRSAGRAQQGRDRRPRQTLPGSAPGA